ncbi:helix-turn-helix domain-containing protein [Cetobacterium sp. 2G large]|uniref:helix-turn-helix domain-containing protein n=1 Tax=Cetobacterium sp. 2G large TaxID=2759680 RepID=UPI00163BC28F|nr:helix-turn-helix domain-containing protein [Cetobacterium sp. 2G large]MBC2854870.1 helix-turn-helix domain-containing protein [Cetobacterium sp. 2G large]
MFLNRKSLNVLNLFLNSDKYAISDLETILKIKKRAINLNIEIINSFLHSHNINGIVKTEKVFYIDKREHQKIKELLSHAPFSPIERRDYILLKLFFTNKVILNNSFMELDITRRTLNYDVEKLKDYLETYNLRLDSLPAKGVFLVGSEISIRALFARYLAKYFIEKESCHNLFINLINSVFPKKEISLAKKIVLNLINKLGASLPPEDFFKIVSIILIHSFREVNFPCTYKNYETPKEILNNKYYEKLLNFLKIHGLEELREYELDLIIKIFLLQDIDKYEEFVESEVTLFLEKLQEKIEIAIPRSKDLLMNISNVIRIGKFKAELNFLEHKETHKLDKTYRKYYKEINLIIKEMFPKFYLEDIIYLTILIKTTVDNIEASHKKLKTIAIIDDSFNHIYGKMLIKYIKGNYQVNILKILDNYEVNDFLEKNQHLDCILTLNDIHFKNKKIPTIKMDFNYILNNVCELEKHGFLKK